MKKTLILGVTLVFSAYTFAQTPQINQQYVDSKTNAKLNQLLTKYSFPKEYSEYLQSKIYSFEYNKQVVNSDTINKTRVVDSLTTQFNTWRFKEKLNIRNAQNLWNKTKSRFQLDNTYKQTFIDYHFYSNQNQTSKITNSTLNELEKLIHNIVNHEVNRVIKLCTKLEKKRNESVNFGKKTLQKELYNTVHQKLLNFEPLILKKETAKYKKIAIDASLTKEKEFNATELKQRDFLFINKAQKFKISKITAENILNLIAQRKTDLKALKNKTKESENQMSSLFENTAPKTKTQIKKEFSKNLASLIDFMQFSKLFGDEFFKNTEQNSNTRLTSLKKNYDLSDQQKEELFKQFYNFYYHEELITAYYSFDKKLRKQKISALKYHFEKDYNQLMESYGYKNQNKTSNIEFKWD